MSSEKYYCGKIFVVQNIKVRKYLGCNIRVRNYLSSKVPVGEYHCYKIKRGPKNPKKGTQRVSNFEQKRGPKLCKRGPNVHLFQNCSQRANMLK